MRKEKGDSKLKPRGFIRQSQSDPACQTAAIFFLFHFLGRTEEANYAPNQTKKIFDRACCTHTKFQLVPPPPPSPTTTWRERERVVSAHLLLLLLLPLPPMTNHSPPLFSPSSHLCSLKHFDFAEKKSKKKKDYYGGGGADRT